MDICSTRMYVKNTVIPKSEHPECKQYVHRSINWNRALLPTTNHIP